MTVPNPVLLMGDISNTLQHKFRGKKGTSETSSSTARGSWHAFCKEIKRFVNCAANINYSNYYNFCIIIDTKNRAKNKETINK